MWISRKAASLFLPFALVVTAALAAEPPRATAADALVLPPDASVEGESFGELTARWWQWADHQAIAPYLDPDGRLCELGQEGSVWFLAGTDGSFNARRECVVPAKRHILMPIINMRSSGVGTRNGRMTRPCASLQDEAAVNNEKLGSAIVLIDGVRVSDVARYRVRSDGCFPIRANDDTAPRVAADGYWLLIKPLPPGRHTISVGANYATGEEGYGGMVQSFEYVLHVGGRADLASL